MNYDDDKPDALPRRPTSSCGGGCHGDSRSVRGLRGATSYFDDRPDALVDWRTNGVPSQTAVSPVISRTQMPASYVDDRPDALDNWKTRGVQTYPPRSPLQQNYGGFYELDEVPKPSIQPERWGYAGYPGYEDDKPDAYQPPPTRMSEQRRVPAYDDDRPDALDTRMAQSGQRRIPQTSIQPAYDEYHEPDYVPKSHAFSGRQGNRSSVSYEDDKPDAWMPSRPPVTPGNRQSLLYMDDRPDALPVEMQMQRMKSKQQRRVSLPFDDRPDALLSIQQSQHVLRLRDESPHAAAQYQTMMQDQMPSYSTYSPCIFEFQPLDQRTAFQTNPIPYFYDDPYLQTGAFYGRSVASIDGSATGWNLGGPFIAIAGHSDSIRREFTARFGLYNTKWSQINSPIVPQSGTFIGKTKGMEDLLDRLEQIGLPWHSIIAVDGFPNVGHSLWQHLSTFTCRFEQTILADSVALPLSQRKSPSFCRNNMTSEQRMNTRDLSIYRCDPRSVIYAISYNPFIYRTVNVWPSTLFGHIPIVTERHSYRPDYWVGKPAFLLAQTVYPPSGYSDAQHSHVYLSHGKIDKTELPSSFSINEDACAGPLLLMRGQYAGGGSSGGAVIVPNDLFLGKDQQVNITRNVAISIHHAAGTKSSYLSEQVSPYTPSGFGTIRDPWFNSTETWKQINHGFSEGLFGGIRRTLSCPEGFAVAGLVGSTIYSGQGGLLTKQWRKSNGYRIGNIGLVCMPYVHPSFYPYSFDSSRVVASGALDVSIHPSWEHLAISGLDYRTTENRYVSINEYMNEYLSTYGYEPRTFLCNNRLYQKTSFQQDLTMCPPGYFIQSVLFKISNSFGIIGEVSSILCKSWDGRHQIWRGTTIGGGKQLPSSDYLLDCGHNSILSHLEVFSDRVLHGLSAFGCRNSPLR